MTSAPTIGRRWRPNVTQNPASAVRKSKPEGPYTLWWQTDGFWTFQDFQTLKEAVEGVNDPAFGSSWVIHKPVRYRLVEENGPSISTPILQDPTRMLIGRGIGML